VAGNIVTASATFEYDTRGPKVYSAVVNSGDACTDNSNVTVTVSYKSRGGDVWNQIGLSDISGGPYSWTTVPVSATTTTADLPWNFSWPPDADYTIYAIARDDLLNMDGEANDDIWVDGNDPTLATVYLRDLDFPADGDGTPVDAQWSNSTTIDIFFTGVTEAGDFDFVISEVGDFSDEVLVNYLDPSVTDLTGGVFKVEFPLAATIADGDNVSPMCKIRDCSGRESASDDDGNGINFDFMSREAASIDAFDAVAATVNYLTGVDFNVTASDATSGVMSMKIYEAGYQSLASWEAFATPADVDLQDLGDGERTVRIKVADKAGNVTGPVEATVIVDTEGPAGGFHIVSTNPDAYAGEPHAYTNTSACELLIDVPSDCVQLAVRNWDKGPDVWTSWVYSVPTAPGAMQTMPWTIDYTVNLAFDTVQVAFEDAAHNWVYVTEHIFVDAPSTAPPAFAAFADEGVYFGDGTDCGVWWDNSYADHYFSLAYYLRWGNYPVYEGVVPPQPTNAPGGGFFITMIPAGYNAFVMTGDPVEDIFRFGIYNVDSAGNATLNTPGMAISTSYILGDLDFDGKVSFMESDSRGIGDFARFASAYYSVDNLMPPDPYWDDDCDFADHFDLYPYPEPDDVVDIEDLMDFVISYTNYHDGVPARGSGQFFAVALDPGGAKFAPTHAPVAIEANIPDRLSAGEEVTIAFRLNDPSGILGLHMVFNLSDNLEIVKVDKGEMFNTGEKTFFYKDINNGSLLIDGVIFSENGFTSQEIAEVTFQAKTDITTFSLDNVEMLVRDANNQDVEAVFNTEITKTVVLPTEFSLGQNYPNPFNPSTSIELALPVASNYVLDIYNIAGQKVETFSGYSEAGIVNIIWDAADAASGVYFYKVNAGSFEATKKMVLIK